MSELTRKPYPSDVSDEESASVAPYLTLVPEESRQRRHPLREVFNAMRWMVRAGAPWIPKDELRYQTENDDLKLPETYFD